jgi:hypothetical protein
VPQQLLDTSQCGQLVDAIYLAGIPAELSHQMEMLQQATSLSQEEHYEQMFKLVELQDSLSDTEANLLRVITQQGELNRQQLADKSEELKQGMIQNLDETISSQINDVLTRQALIESICSAVNERLGTIKNPANVPIDSHWKTNSKLLQFAETAGLAATMLFTAMASGLVAAVAVGRTLAEKNVVPQEQFDHWVQQWKQQSAPQYKCIFLCDDCQHISGSEGEWRIHAVKHFNGLWKDTPCIICAFSKDNSLMLKGAWMEHTVRHVRAGHKFSQMNIRILTRSLDAHREYREPYTRTNYNIFPILQRNTKLVRKKSSENCDRKIEILSERQNQKQSTAIEGFISKAGDEIGPNFGWWRCSECNREINRLSHGDMICLDCGHAKCVACDDPFYSNLDLGKDWAKVFNESGNANDRLLTGSGDTAVETAGFMPKEIAIRQKQVDTRTCAD